jgi:hypothetical protein
VLLTKTRHFSADTLTQVSEARNLRRSVLRWKNQHDIQEKVRREAQIRQQRGYLRQ